MDWRPWFLRAFGWKVSLLAKPARQGSPHRRPPSATRSLPPFGIHGDNECRHRQASPQPPLLSLLATCGHAERARRIPRLLTRFSIPSVSLRSFGRVNRHGGIVTHHLQGVVDEAFIRIDEFEHLQKPEQIAASVARVAARFGFTAFILTGLPATAQRLGESVLLDAWPRALLTRYL